MPNLTKKKVLTSELSLGMYVACLDRPWLETPFLFQGFPITTNADIDKLQEYCEYVYVDQSLSETSPVERMKMAHTPLPDAAGRSGILGRIFAGVLRLFGVRRLQPVTHECEAGQPGSAYRDQVSLVDELGNARETHNKAQSIIREMMTGLRTGGRLELDVVQSVVAPMVDSVLRNNDALAWLSRLRSKDDYSYGHSIATSVYAIVLGRHIGYSREELHLLGLGGLLLDVGKTKISRELLTKEETLTEEEMAIARSHVQHSFEILSEFLELDDASIAEAYASGAVS